MERPGRLSKGGETGNNKEGKQRDWRQYQGGQAKVGRLATTREASGESTGRSTKEAEGKVGTLAATRKASGGTGRSPKEAEERWGD